MAHRHHAIAVDFILLVTLEVNVEDLIGFFLRRSLASCKEGVPFQTKGDVKARLLKSKRVPCSQQALCVFASLREAKKESRKDAKTQREIE